jgi:hypothetical protein
MTKEKHFIVTESDEIFDNMINLDKALGEIDGFYQKNMSREESMWDTYLDSVDEPTTPDKKTLKKLKPELIGSIASTSCFRRSSKVSVSGSRLEVVHTATESKRANKNLT